MGSFAFSVEEWRETWSVGNAVLQGMGLEMTTDFLFFDLPDALLKEGGENITAHYWRKLSLLIAMRWHKHLTC